jgi:hypothetical protein
MKRTTLFGKNAAVQKLIAPNSAPPMHNDRHPQISMNPATNIPTSCVTPYNTKTKLWLLEMNFIQGVTRSLDNLDFSKLT